MLRMFKEVLAKNSRAAVARDNQRTGLAHIERQKDGQLNLSTRAWIADDGSNWSDHAASLLARMDAKRTPVSAVLAEGAYRLQLLEMPNVPADELLAAVRWRLKDLIDFPVEEAVVELLDMPAHANPGAATTAYAVVTRRAEVLQQLEFMKQAELQLDVIDIPELCVRNIAVLLPQDAAGVAFLHFTECCGYLTITRNGTLHLTRHLDTGRREFVAAMSDAFAMQELIASVSLEVQRSLDYYESHYDCQPVTDLVLGPGAGLEGLPAALTEQLGLSVDQIDLHDLFVLDADISPEEQGDCLLAVGAALRSDQSAEVVARV